MPESFNKEQERAFELVRQRLFLEKTIEETIFFNRSLNFDNSNPNLKLTTSAEELIEVFKLRSDVYTDMGYQKEFPDAIEGLNFDKFDNSSAIVFYQKDNKEVTATCRLIFDSENKLPSEGKLSFDNIRNEHKIIGEISRNIVKSSTSGKKGLNLEFKYLMAGMHNVFIHNEINMTLSGMKKEDYRMFSKFGGNEVIAEIESYGNLNQTSLVVSWDPSKASKFFKSIFKSFCIINFYCFIISIIASIISIIIRPF
jgi:N-acyl-L-homoserine lactone synthetase